MADFNFIVTSALRECLESDYAELRVCIDGKAWKAAHVLAGSIVEAVLIDALIEAGENQAALEQMTFAALITLAKQKQIIPDEAVDLSTVIRQYRNLIHPGRLITFGKNSGQSWGDNWFSGCRNYHQVHLETEASQVRLYC